MIQGQKQVIFLLLMVLLQFKDYFIDSANWTIPDDKGPVTVEVTCKPRNLHSCTVKTGYVLQG